MVYNQRARFLAPDKIKAKSLPQVEWQLDQDIPLLKETKKIKIIRRQNIGKDPHTGPLVIKKIRVKKIDCPRSAEPLAPA